RVADDLQRGYRIAVLEAHPVLLAVAPDGQLEPFAKRVDHRDANPMQAPRDLVGVVVARVLELPAGVELGHDDLGGGDPFFLVDADGNAAAIVLDAYRAVGIELAQDEIA